MAKNLVIVESPAKAKTIEGYLGKDYQVKSSYGHVRDLPKDDFAIDIENGFEPTYKISNDKKDVVKELKKLSKEAETIFLASDDDREGEAISWHLAQALDLDDQKTRRIVFREITKNAIQNAIQNPRGIDEDLVNAQQARRILDRLVGYELSPVLWKKIKTGLSAGRVQSVAVRLVVEREREIEQFNAESSFKITALFNLENGKVLKADLPKKFKTEEEAKTFLEQCKDAAFNIENLETKPAKKSPAPPFTTSTLQQEASRKLSFPVAMTMSVAQKLYEAGKISYMRTDSVNLSQEAIASAKGEIVKAYGEEFFKERHFKTKSQGAQEAHEAIRPTNFSVLEAGKDSKEQRLYELIWKRAIASQMSEAQLEKTTATIGISTNDEKLVAKGEVIKFEGFLKVYIESTDEEGDEEEQQGMLPPLSVGQELDLKSMLAREGFTRHPPRYTEASLVKKLEEMGIGRPSTYAPTISTVIKRNYIAKENRDGHERQYRELLLASGTVDESTKTEITGAEKNKLFPTNTAMVVNDFLVEHFPNVIDFSFTAKVEQEFDEIASGKIQWRDMIKLFYGGFHSKIENTEQLKRSEVNAGRELGEDPKTGKKIIAKLGRYGAYVQLGEIDEENEEAEKPKFASLRHGQLIETITLEEALELFKLPREVGEFEGEVMTAAVGRYGPYIRHQGKFVSLKPEQDPLTITEEEAIELIQQKREEDANKYIKTFDEDENVFVLNGRYGPYIKFGKKNVKIPKDKKPEELTFEECKELAEKTPEKKGRGGGRRKAKK
ncbi:type I DNA topoisomerase [Marinoscillum furvescens]|uniref:DNA topoisomerase 1 n=1 Tax=Marinoscillum furvescens DSM 4134 TaxID=1122208 RepID=A0A3D9LGB7_MARFU|nr:type I DNA topoisomerase [Marinoscillum furvescens]REE05647.1 DNA topoisomerase I [Marinoscillum furvescens DSM 4134]